MGGRKTADDGAYLVFEVKHLIIVHTVTVRSTGEIPLGLVTDRLEIAVFFYYYYFFFVFFCGSEKQLKSGIIKSVSSLPENMQQARYTFIQ